MLTQPPIPVFVASRITSCCNCQGFLLHFGRHFHLTMPSVDDGATRQARCPRKPSQFDAFNIKNGHATAHLLVDRLELKRGVMRPPPFGSREVARDPGDRYYEEALTFPARRI
jgi:hypothetical protein